MAQGTILGQTGGGSKINGIIEEYKVASGGNVNAGDFVKFIKNQYFEDMQLSSELYSGTTISAVQLTENKIFIAHGYGSDSKLYGIVCTINGTTITTGTDTAIISTQGASKFLSVVKLSNDKVVITHGLGTGKNINGIVCTINGTTITTGIDTVIKTTSTSIRAISTVKLSNNKIFIAYSYANNYILYGIVCTIEEAAIAVGTDTKLNSDTYSGYYISAISLSANKVLITHSQGTSYYLQGTICTIDEAAITVQKSTLLSNKGNSSLEMASLQLASDKVLIAHRYGGEQEECALMVCTVGETSLEVNMDNKLNEGINEIKAIMLLLNANIFILYRETIQQGSSFTYANKGTTGKVNETNIVLEEGTQIDLSLGKTCSLLLSDNEMLIIHGDGSSSSKLYCAFNFVDVVDKTQEKTNIFGVAKTKGTEGKTVKVIVPN